eukprot:2647449-Pleurochrysis_carterae.AAC.2
MHVPSDACVHARVCARACVCARARASFLLQRVARLSLLLVDHHRLADATNASLAPAARNHRRVRRLAAARSQDAVRSEPAVRELADCAACLRAAAHVSTRERSTAEKIAIVQEGCTWQKGRR